MNRLLLVLLAIACLAPTIIDQTDAHFNGTTTNTNVTNNTVRLAGEQGNYSLSGEYISDVKDLGSNPGASLGWNATSPSGTSILVYARAGNTTNPPGGWSAWDAVVMNGETLDTPVARYLQYRLQLATTDPNRTSAVQFVRINYTQQGAVIAAATSQNADLDSDSTGAHRFHVTLQDTLTISSRQARHRIDNGSWSSWSAMTQTGSYWYIDVPEPAGTWSSEAGELLYVQVLVNNTGGVPSNNTFSDLIDDINHAPTIDPLSDTTAVERQQKTIALSGSDPDGDALTFTSTHGTVTSSGNTTATLAWTPDNTETGLVNVTVTVSDGDLTDQTTFTANVTDVNDAPVMAAVADQTGHYGDLITFEIVVADNDTQENLTYRVVPDLFDIEAYDDPNSSATEYHARGRFYALDDHKGFHSLTFIVSDTQASSRSNATLNITYCGDGTCQSSENETSCRLDCREGTDRQDRIALEVPDRLCTNQSIIIQAYNASDRSECFTDGRTFEFNAYCEPEDGVGLTIYQVNNSRLTEISSLTTNSTGQATLLTMVAARYKIVAEQEGFIGSEEILTIKACGQSINNQHRVIEFERPDIVAEERRIEIPPDLERPDITPQGISVVSIIIWWVIIPLFGAALLYTSSIYYTVYRDTDPNILRMRIWFWEKRIQYGPRMQPFIDRVRGWMTPLKKPAAKLAMQLGLDRFWEWSKQKLQRLDNR